MGSQWRPKKPHADVSSTWVLKSQDNDRAVGGEKDWGGEPKSPGTKGSGQDNRRALPRGRKSPFQEGHRLCSSPVSRGSWGRQRRGRVEKQGKYRV